MEQEENECVGSSFGRQTVSIPRHGTAFFVFSIVISPKRSCYEITVPPLNDGPLICYVTYLSLPNSLVDGFSTKPSPASSSAKLQGDMAVITYCCSSCQIGRAHV